MNRNEQLEYLRDARTEYQAWLTQPDLASRDAILGHAHARNRIEYLNRAIEDMEREQ